MAILLFSSGTKAADLWKTLLPTPTSPAALKSGYAPVNGPQIWYAVFGEGRPVLLLHGGLANSNYWGNLVPDSRGHRGAPDQAEPIAMT